MPSTDEKVHAGKKDAVIEPEIESANGRVHESASRNKNEPPMVFRLLPPGNRQCHARAKHHHVEERNREESIYAALMEH